MKGQYEYNLLLSGLVCDGINSKIPNECFKKGSIYLHNSTIDTSPDFKEGVTEISFRLNPKTTRIFYDRHFREILETFVSVVGGEYTIDNNTNIATINRIITDYNLKSIADGICYDPKLDLKYEHVPESTLLDTPLFQEEEIDEITITDPHTGAFYEIIGSRIVEKNMRIP